MASSHVKQSCVKCDKGGGIAICSGCQQQYCVKHFIEHRQELAIEMDQIGQQHDLLRRDLSKDMPEHSLFTSINTWERESITKIQVAAEVARADLQQILDRTKNDLKISVDKLTNELQSSRELDDYTEIDIEKWMKNLKELQMIFETPVNLNLLSDNDSQSSINLITINTQLSIKHTSQISNKLIHERFDTVYGLTNISENGLVAQNIGDNYSRICGKNEYSSGVHQISFRLDEQTNSCPFLGIISLTDVLNLREITLSSANGWLDLDYPIINGKTQAIVFSNRTIQSGDEVTLIIDCDNQEILLEHHRTKRLIRQSINLQQCPFPWKILVALSSKHGSIRILNYNKST
ncbi:unnamed protein product [Adineta steineri]|uniref:B box-type domain-containing protein n=1 Tax=Adineta steineri TaxID=433720 RepID=A0A814IVT8_9BILA|nr:unnamed protein product [Adineta steineri]CAF1028704.1 unnamed protein product [Adineta steineri]CAF3681483.1 unnamed protein product [Adineta steineri]CAF3835228.1 unnamed protein product [Adineta steineri]